MLVLSPSKISTFLVAFLALACARFAFADPKITAAITTIQLRDNVTTSPVNLFVRIDGTKKKPTVRILSVSQAGPTVSTDGDPKVEVELQDGVFWKVPVKITGLPMGSTANVSLVVEVEKTISDVLSYSITNAPVIPDAEVNPSGTTIFTETSSDMPLTVNLKGTPLRGLKVCRAALTDSNTGIELPAHWLSLYLDGDDLKANPQIHNKYVTLVAPSSKVHLYVSPDFKNDGVFAGTFELCADNKPSVAKLSLIVNSTSTCIKLFGAFLILLGIAVYLLVTVFLKQHSLRLIAEIPASRLRGALMELETSAKDVSGFTKVQLPELLGPANQAHSLKYLIDQLSEAKLESYLPARLLSNPFSQPDSGADYQQYLKPISDQQKNDAIIVGDGLKRVKSMWSTLDQTSAQTALQQLDKLGLLADTSTSMQTDVNNIVNGIARINKKSVVGSLDAFHKDYRIGKEHTPTTHEILFQIEHVSFLGWLIWAVITFILGCAVLIVSHHGFGTWQDLLKCFLWGIGIQAAGQGLQSLSPTSAATSFSLQVGR